MSIYPSIERILPTHIVAAAGVVLNQSGEILLVNTYNDGWVLPGGQIENGENLIDGVKREIFEESGIEVEVGELFCISSNTSSYPGHSGVKEVPTKVILDFICRATGGCLRSSNENSESKWVPVDQVLHMITAETNRTRFSAYLEYTGRPLYLEYNSKPQFLRELLPPIEVGASCFIHRCANGLATYMMSTGVWFGIIHPYLYFF